GEGAKGIPDRNLRVAVKEAKKERDGAAYQKGDGTIAEGKDTTEEEQSWNELDGDSDAERGSGSESEPPFAARNSFGLNAGEKENAGDHRQEHEAVEVGRAGEAVNDEGIPGVPGGVGVTLM